ncbi:MAG: hypothetical protein JXA44_04380 [Methanospirillaceae archaeon]|nr:hypothetical protein [Methanospirillaceae archaeon]
MGTKPGSTTSVFSHDNVIHAPPINGSQRLPGMHTIFSLNPSLISLGCRCRRDNLCSSGIEKLYFLSSGIKNASSAAEVLKNETVLIITEQIGIRNTRIIQGSWFSMADGKFRMQLPDQSMMGSADD